MFDVTVASFSVSSMKRPKEKKRHYYVNSNLVLLFEFIGPKLVSIPNFS